MGLLLETMPDTEAVIVSDLSAFGARTECQRRGVAVPNSVSVAGFGDYDIGQICVPSLTTINPFPIEIGEPAARLILGLLNGKSIDRILTIAAGTPCAAEYSDRPRHSRWWHHPIKYQ